jgi:hypothetical protein
MLASKIIPFLFYIPHSCSTHCPPIIPRLGGSWTTRDKRPAPTKEVKIFLHTPQKLHLFMVPPVKRGMSVCFASKRLFLSVKIKIKIEGSD